MVASLAFAAETVNSNMAAFNNLVCPVSGAPAKTANMGVYNDVIYRFCCPEHLAAFQKNPHLYLTNLPNQGVIVDLANEICPVSGQPAQKDVFVVIDGYKVHAKCAGSSAMLRRFPAPYLAKARRIQGMTPEQLKKEFVPLVSYNNAVCPVTGKPANMRFRASHSNIVYKFSSLEACYAFTNAPRQYVSKLPNNGRIVDMGNDFCPDAGDAVDKKLSVVVEGQRIYVGCKGCAMNVMKDPQGYITRVKALMAMTPAERKADFAKRGPCDNSTCPSKAGGAAKESASSPCATCPSAAKGECSSDAKPAPAPAPATSACATCPNAGKEACASAPTEAPAKEVLQIVAYNNSHCPVTGQPTDTRIVTVYDNIVYKFNSTDARAAFEKDPATYLSKLPGNGRIVDMGNDFCPVAGDPVDKKLSVVVEGKRIYVGCPVCAATVLKEPQTYIARVETLIVMTPAQRKAAFAKLGPCENSSCPSAAGAAAKESASSPCATCPSAAKGECSSTTPEAAAPQPAKAACATCPAHANGSCDGNKPDCNK
jgi:YHS domain-containing protein